MEDQPISVTGLMREQVARNELASVVDGWAAFAHYLRMRRFADLRTVFAADEALQLESCIVNRVPDRLLKKTDDPVVEWFRNFESRSDVVEAFRKFLINSGR